MPTVQRILTGRSPAASFENSWAIAHALGMELDATPTASASEVLEHQAREKAIKLIRMVQGTSVLEAQGVSKQQLTEMIQRTVGELLNGSRRRLWAE